MHGLSHKCQINWDCANSCEQFQNLQHLNIRRFDVQKSLTDKSVYLSVQKAHFETVICELISEKHIDTEESSMELLRKLFFIIIIINRNFEAMFL